jgi:hypothetical protein
MVIREGGDWLEVVATDRVPDHLPTPGDTRLSVAIESQGFAGRGSTWVEASRLAAFVAELRELEASRRGAAEVESISPGEFRLRVWATDRAGHVALAGRLSHGGQALEFGFAFCPSELPGLVAGFEAITLGRA